MLSSSVSIRDVASSLRRSEAETVMEIPRRMPQIRKNATRRESQIGLFRLIVPLDNLFDIKSLKAEALIKARGAWMTFRPTVPTFFR